MAILYPLGILESDFWEYWKCAQLFAHWVHWGQMAGDIQNVLNMCPLGISGSHNRVYLKCTQHLITGHIGVTCWLWSQCFHYVPSGYLGPCPQWDSSLEQIWKANVSSWLNQSRETQATCLSFSSSSRTLSATCEATDSSLWLLSSSPSLTSSHWGQGPKYPLGTWWKYWDRSQHVTQMCPVIKCWVHFEYTLLCNPDMPSGYILSTFWMSPAIWLQCTQWANNWVHFQYSQKSDPNMPSG